jgi:hypothetical protein
MGDKVWIEPPGAEHSNENESVSRLRDYEVHVASKEITESNKTPVQTP